MKYFFTILFYLFYSISLYAQEPIPNNQQDIPTIDENQPQDNVEQNPIDIPPADNIDKNNDTKNTENKYGISPFPVIAYSPDTSFIVGAGAFLFYKSYPDIENQKNDSIVLLGFFTMKKQFLTTTEFTKYFMNNKYYTTMSIAAVKFPNEFYGIGPETVESNLEKYTEFAIPYNASFMFLIHKYLYIGPASELVYSNVFDIEDNGILARNNIPGIGKQKLIGGGISIVYNSRDSDNYPTKGQYVKFRALDFNKYILSDYNYAKYTFDYRYYHELLRKHIIGFHFHNASTFGDVPFQQYPSLGGSNIIRGYKNGRYIDYHMAGIQTEYRYPIYQRFSGTVFGGIGEVAGKYVNFASNIKGAAGLGLRFFLDTEQKVNIRFDIAINDEFGTATYFMVMEAF